MAANNEGSAQSEQVNDLAASAAEGMLGPNPFVGLRPRDILATAQQIGAQAFRQPTLLMEQEAALARDLMAVLGGSADATPPQGDKRFTDPAWQSNSLYRMTLQGYVAWRNALTGFVERSAFAERVLNQGIDFRGVAGRNVGTRRPGVDRIDDLETRCFGHVGVGSVGSECRGVAIVRVTDRVIESV